MRPAHAYGPLTLRLPLVALALACAPAPATAPAPAFDKRVEGQRGMVSASHPDAAAAGLEVLRAGGNAVDAAVAVAFALSVVDPSQTGLGGAGGMVIWRRPQREAHAVNFYARTGSDPDWERVDTAAARQPINARAAGVPGTVAGMLEAHERWGRLPRAAVLAPAIRLARDGFVVSPLLARTTESARARLAADSAAARLFLPGGAAVRAGDRLVQTELARTIEAIAERGPEAFYDGTQAERAVAMLRRMGSAVTLDDWSGYRTEWGRPLCTPWLGYTVLGAPPALGGVTVLEALNLLAGVRADTLGSPTHDPRTVLAAVGAMRVADTDRRVYRGHPAHYGVPARGMASPAFAAERVGGVDAAPTAPLAAGNPWPQDARPAGEACDRLGDWGPSRHGPERAAGMAVTPEGEEAASHTSHFSVVDADRTAVAVTFTVGVLFGSGVYVNGYFLNSGANNFDRETRGPSRYGSSTIAPTVVLAGDDPRLVIGAAGSQYIPTSVTQVTFRMLALGEDPWVAIAAPRVQPARAGVAEVEVEPGFAPGVYAALRDRGFLPVTRTADLMFGGVHAVFVAPNGRLVGVADPRRDGAAAGW